MTAGKLSGIAELPPVSLEDASLSAWAPPRDGTAGLIYSKGSLAGLLLDILIRDGSDNRRSLDDVMRELHVMTAGSGQGFTGREWWRTVARASGGRSFARFQEDHIEGREPLPLADILPLAGMKLVADSTRAPRIGLQVVHDTSGVHVTMVVPGGMAALAGVQPGDLLRAVGGERVRDVAFGQQYRLRYENAAPGTPLPIEVKRADRILTLDGKLRFDTRVEFRIVPDTAASPRALRIREGILRGITNGR
jgi:predicted metalloprotease with PDZ domain